MYYDDILHELAFVTNVEGKIPAERVLEIANAAYEEIATLRSLLSQAKKGELDENVDSYNFSGWELRRVRDVGGTASTDG